VCQGFLSTPRSGTHYPVLYCGCRIWDSGGELRGSLRNRVETTALHNHVPRLFPLIFHRRSQNREKSKCHVETERDRQEKAPGRAAEQGWYVARDVAVWAVSGWARAATACARVVGRPWRINAVCRATR